MRTFHYFASDHHFGHANIIKYCNRPFGDPAEMNEAILAAHNSTVQPTDQVLFLGDICMGKLDDSMTYAAQLNGDITLVPGNHDRPFLGGENPSTTLKSMTESKQNKWRKMHQKYVDAGFNMQQFTPITIDLGKGRFATTSHFPIAGDDSTEDPDRFQDARMPDNKRSPETAFHLCGHVHDAWQHMYSANGTLMINVGIDVWDYKPVSTAQIVELIDSLS